MAHDFEISLAFDDIEGAEDFADVVRPTLAALVEQAALVAPMTRFEGFTFAIDYDAALRDLSLTRGFGRRPLARTNDDLAQGYAMAPLVLRNGVFKTRIVMSASVMVGLLSKEERRRRWATGTILHELGHAAEHELFDRALPGLIGKPLPDAYEAQFYAFCESAFKEYFACRVAATTDPEVGDGYAEAFLESCRRLGRDVPPARLAYRVSNDMGSFGQLAFARVGDLLKYAGYWMGHSDGLAKGWRTAATRQAIRREQIDRAMDRLRHVFRRLWERRESWATVEEFYAVHRVMEDVLRRYGLWPRRNGDGMWIDVA